MTHSFNVENTIQKFGYDPRMLTKYSANTVILICCFCLKDFEKQWRDKSRIKKSISCDDCLSICSYYTRSQTFLSEHEFYLSSCQRLNLNVLVNDTINNLGYDPRLLAPGSRKKVLVKCEFCLQIYKTGFNVINNKSSVTSCKKCDAIASSYVRKKLSDDKYEFYKSRRPIVDESLLNSVATFLKYGYYPRDLASSSAKRIITNCAHCSIQLEIPISKFTTRQGRISCSKKECVWAKTQDTLELKHGVRTTLDIPSVQEKLTNPITEQIVESILRDIYEIDFVRSFSVGQYSFDFYIPSLNLLIECQGDFFHKFKEFGYTGTPQDRNKSNYIEKFTNHKLVWIYEHEINLGRIREILDNHIGKLQHSRIDVDDLSDLEFREITDKEAHSFLAIHNYIGNLGTVSTRFGAFYNNELVSVCVFGGAVSRNRYLNVINNAFGASYGPKELREIRRFCVRDNTHNSGLRSFLLERFCEMIKRIEPDVKGLINFLKIDLSSDWIPVSGLEPSYHYVDPKTRKSMNPETVHGMTDRHFPEEDFARQAGLIRMEEISKEMWFRKF